MRQSIETDAPRRARWRTRARPAYYVREEHMSSVLLRENRRYVVAETINT